MTQSTTHYYILNLTYTRPLAEVELLIDEHSHYLQSAFDRGDFLLSGRKDPWTGGIILAKASSQEAIQAIIAQDPLLKANVIRYEVIEFHPTRANADFSSVLATEKK